MDADLSVLSVGALALIDKTPRLASTNNTLMFYWWTLTLAFRLLILKFDYLSTNPCVLSVDATLNILSSGTNPGVLTDTNPGVLSSDTSHGVLSSDTSHGVLSACTNPGVLSSDTSHGGLSSDTNPGVLSSDTNHGV